MSTPPITPEEAKVRNLRPLTTPCGKDALWIVDNILSDLRRGGIEAAAVAVRGGIEVWRANNGFRKS